MITAEATHHRQIACSTNSSMPVRYNVKANPTVESAAKRRATRRSAANLGCRPTRPTRSEERRVGKGVDLGGRRIIKKKKKKNKRSQHCDTEETEQNVLYMQRQDV